jgi:hypothetical protein
MCRVSTWYRVAVKRGCTEHVVGTQLSGRDTLRFQGCQMQSACKHVLLTKPRQYPPGSTSRADHQQERYRES